MRLHTKEMGGEQILACPACGEDYTHIERIEVGARSEDSPAIVVQVDAITGEVLRQRLPASTDMPSRRRHWLTIFVQCEMCGATTPVTFAQHKGWTLVNNKTLE